MPQLTLTWQEAGQPQTVTLGSLSSFPEEVKIGRDRARCDFVLPHPTVSGLHVAIFFDSGQQQFKLRNLRATNPPLVDHQRVDNQDVSLHIGSMIQLGQMTLQVSEITLPTTESPIPPTILLPPEPDSATPTPGLPANYGLKCPNCQRVSPYDQIDFGCPWCGTSLAASVSVLIQP